jgi:hypothetical protein
MITMAVNVPNIADVTSWYRAMGPINHLRKACTDLNVVQMQTYNWATLGGCDVLFMQRPYTDDHVSLMDIAKTDAQIPVWVDYDDLLLAVPTDNTTYFHYMNEKTQKNIRTLITQADVVTVSTDHLRNMLLSLNKNIVVVNNGLDLSRLTVKIGGKMSQRPQKLPERTKRIAWRGSRTHERDVFTMARTLVDKARASEGWDWHFIGDNMWFVTDSMVHERTYVTAPVDCFKYHRHLFELAPSVLHVPLHLSQFNLCKSNIAWLEASWAGAYTIAPKWPEWDKPGVGTYNDENDFGDRIEEVLQGKIDIEACVRASWSHILEHYTLDKVNVVRKRLLEDLTGKSIERGV